MAKKYATMHIQMREEFQDIKNIEELADILGKIAYESDGDDYFINYCSDCFVVSLNVPFDDSDLLDAVEAGDVLGQTYLNYTNSGDGRGCTFWRSINELEVTNTSY